MNGIAIVGTMLVDKLNEISAFPQKGELTQIRAVSRAVGGIVPNVGIDLKRLDPSLPVYAVGKIGKDGDGDFLRQQLADNGLDISGVKESDGNTSFTDVMTIPGGQRTFFTYAGTCATFGLDDINFDRLPVSMLHLGYFLLLDKVDGGDGVRILQEAKRRGIRTSIDLVTENSDRYGLVLPCLPYVDNLIVNETEAGRMAGIDPAPENLHRIAEKLRERGVRERVIIHMPDRSVCLSDDGYTELPSLPLPAGFIKGTTGAGDAFCAGSLLGICRGYPDNKILATGTLAAMGALRGQDAVSGMATLEELKAVGKPLTEGKNYAGEFE